MIVLTELFLLKLLAIIKKMNVLLSLTVDENIGCI